MPDRNSNSTEGRGEALSLRLWDLLIPEREDEALTLLLQTQNLFVKDFIFLFMGNPSGEMSTL